MRRLRPVLISSLTLAPLLGAGVAAASTSHAKFWQNPTHKVDCGIMIYAPQGHPVNVLCSSSKIPAPKNVPANEGDPGFVQLSKTGKPKLLRLSQDSFVSDHIVTLGKGSTWNSLGVTCTIAAKSVTCKNASGHGFKIGGPGKGWKQF